VKLAPVRSSGAELPVARFRDQVVVATAEGREVEGRGIFDDGDHEEARPVFALRVDGEPEVDGAFDFARHVAVAPERRRDRGIFFGRADEREGDQVRE